MKAITKTLLDTIDTMINMSNTFNERYDKLQHTIEPDLFEDFVYFANRGKFIGETLERSDFLGIMKRFRFVHVSPEMGKTTIDNFQVDLSAIQRHLNVIKRELEEGLIYKVSELIRAEIFSDFLEGAKYLLDEGWKDAAAVIIGGVLENELRQLSTVNNLPIKDIKGKGLSIDPMNINLCKAGVYKLYVQKMITPYAGIRNDAAHGDWDKYLEKDVRDMYDFVVDFKNQIQ